MLSQSVLRVDDLLGSTGVIVGDFCRCDFVTEWAIYQDWLFIKPSERRDELWIVDGNDSLVTARGSWLSVPLDTVIPNPNTSASVTPQNSPKPQPVVILERTHGCMSWMMSTGALL